jgi:hypothetical protein
MFGVGLTRNFNFNFDCQLDEALVLDWPAVKDGRFNKDKFSFDTNPSNYGAFLMAQLHEHIVYRGLTPRGWRRRCC